VVLNCIPTPAPTPAPKPAGTIKERVKPSGNNTQAVAPSAVSLVIPASKWAQPMDDGSCSVSWFGDSGHAEYKVAELLPDGHVASVGVWRRYSEFAGLNTQLANLAPPNFPGKKTFGNNSPEHIEARRKALELWLKTAARNVKAAPAQQALLIQFAGVKPPQAKSSSGEPLTMPADLRSSLDTKAIGIMESMFNRTHSADGTPWKLEQEKKGQYTIWSCSIPAEEAKGSSLRRWKFEWELPCGVQAAAKHCFDYAVRSTWDAAIGAGYSPQAFAPDSGASTFPGLVAGNALLAPSVPKLAKATHSLEDIATFTTTPQVMGMIAPRDFVTLRRIELLEDGSVVAVLVPGQHQDIPEVPNVIRGVCPEGGGWIVPTATGCRYMSILIMDIKGNIPLWAINQATTGNLTQGRANLAKHASKNQLPDTYEGLQVLEDK